MLPTEFCAFLQGYFELADAGRSEKAKPLALNAEQVALIRDRLQKVYEPSCATHLGLKVNKPDALGSDKANDC